MKKAGILRSLLAVVLLAALGVGVFAAVYTRPRTVDVSVPAVILSPEGAEDTLTTVTLSGTYRRGLAIPSRLCFTGTVTVDAIADTGHKENWAQRLELSWNPDMGCYIGGFFYNRTDDPGLASGWLYVNREKTTCVLMVTLRDSAETAVVVAPAQSREEADAILENLGLSIRQGEFG